MMEVGAYLVGMLNTNTKWLYKDTIENITKDWPGVSYLVLRSKPTVPRGRPLIDISYKYNAHKVVYFIVTYNAGITQTGIPYLSKYPDQFTNVSIRYVAHPLDMSKKYVNEVGSHNKARQSGLVLEKLYVTQCGWLGLWTTVSMGMTINGFWKLFHYGFNRYHYEKSIGIRELSEQLAQYFFNNPFSHDSGNPANNIIPLDEFDDGDTVSTCRALHFSSCISPSAAARTISDITLYSA